MASQPITWDGRDAQGRPLPWDGRGLTWDGTVPQWRTKMPHLRVSLAFAKGTDKDVADTTDAILQNLYDNPAYTTTPVTKVALQTALTDFNTAIGDQKQGGTAATGIKNQKRDVLVELLRQLADYVERTCNNDLPTLQSSGFEAVSTNRAQQPLEKPIIVTVMNGHSGELVVKVKPVPNAHSYEVRYAVVTGGTAGPWQDGGVFTNSRAMTLDGLTAGTLYKAQVRAVGGSTGYSDWSDPSEHMSM